MKSNLYHALTFSTAVSLIGVSASLALPSKVQTATTPKSAEEAGWTLAFTDRFDRADLGEAWEVVQGSWKVADGMLHGNGVIISSRSFPARDKTGMIYTGGYALGFIRMEFGFTPMPRSDAEPLGQVAEWEDAGCGAFINALWEGNAAEAEIEPGYTFQLQGRKDETLKIIKRGGQVVATTDASTAVLTPGKRHQIVIENDEGHLRFLVDGKPVFEHNEMFSIMGSGYDKVGFCFGWPSRVDNLKVYYKRLPGGLDRDEML